jgi:hypothetical protein
MPAPPLPAAATFSTLEKGDLMDAMFLGIPGHALVSRPIHPPSCFSFDFLALTAH